MTRAKYILLLPLSYNDGSEIPKDVKERILDRLFCIANGYTIAGTVHGAYRMASGKKQVDWAMQVWVVVAEEDEGELKEATADFARLLDQESIYLERTNSVVDFISPDAIGGSDT